MDYLNRAVKQILGVYNALPPKKRLFSIITILLTIGSLVGLVYWANRVEYRPLYTGLNSEDAGAVVNKLREMKVLYKIGVNGNSIMVPAASVYELRMEMAREGIPQSSGIGYEIFDRQSIGVTEFIQKVNYQRALQSELSRTINQFSEVKSSRIHLAIPEKTLFIDQQEKPRAAVVLKLLPGKRLRETQIQGIIHLVASSVEGLSEDDVNIVDSHGNLLAGGEKKTSLSGLSFSQQELQQTTEEKLEKKIELMLADIVGPGSVTAKVSVAMDFTQVEQTEENYDPDKVAVRSEQRSTEKSSGKRPVSSGIPGVMSNTPDLNKPETSAVPTKTVNYNKSDETINY